MDDYFPPRPLIPLPLSTNWFLTAFLCVPLSGDVCENDASNILGDDVFGTVYLVFGTGYFVFGSEYLVFWDVYFIFGTAWKYKVWQLKDKKRGCNFKQKHYTLYKFSWTAIFIIHTHHLAHTLLNALQI